MVQKGAEFRREVFQHEPMVIPLLNGTHLLLEGKESRNQSQLLLEALITSPQLTISRNAAACGMKGV